MVIAPLQITLRRRDRDGHAAVPPAGSSLARGQPARARSLTGHLSTDGVKPSIGSAGLACDSTLTESTGGPLKTECIRAAVAGRFGPPGRVGEQPSDLGVVSGMRRGRRAARHRGRREAGLRVGAVSEHRAGDGANREGGHGARFRRRPLADSGCCAVEAGRRRLERHRRAATQQLRPRAVACPWQPKLAQFRRSFTSVPRVSVNLSHVRFCLSCLVAKRSPDLPGDGLRARRPSSAATSRRQPPDLRSRDRMTETQARPSFSVILSHRRSKLPRVRQII
jgi:hypothetical protein